MVRIHTDKAVKTFNQSRVSRDHDERHDASIPDIDEKKEEIKHEDDVRREDHNLLREGDVLMNKHFRSTTIRSVMFWSLEEAPAVVG